MLNVTEIMDNITSPLWINNPLNTTMPIVFNLSDAFTMNATTNATSGPPPEQRSPLEVLMSMPLFLVGFNINVYKYLVLFPVALVGNSLILAVIGRQTNSVSAYVYMTAIAIVDFLVIALKSVFLLTATYRVNLTDAGCKVLAMLVDAMPLYSALLVIAMTTERFIAVWFPFKVHQAARANGRHQPACGGPVHSSHLSRHLDFCAGTMHGAQGPPGDLGPCPRGGNLPYPPPGRNGVRSRWHRYMAVSGRQYTRALVRLLELHVPDAVRRCSNSHSLHSQRAAHLQTQQGHGEADKHAADCKSRRKPAGQNETSHSHGGHCVLDLRCFDCSIHSVLDRYIRL